MNIRQKEVFLDKLKHNLKKAGLPTDPRHIIGQQYWFECEHGSHNHMFVGTVQAIEISDEGGLDFYVSNPVFWGNRLISIKHANGKWMAYVEAEGQQLTEKEKEEIPAEEIADRLIERQIAAQFFEGEFRLL